MSEATARASTPDWVTFEAFLRDQAYRTLNNDPQILLEQDGGPEGLRADMYYARLIGFEDEIVADGFRLEAAVPEVFLPIAASMRRLIQPNPDPFEPPRRAVYRLQSGCAVMTQAGEVMPADAAPHAFGADCTVRIAYLRYRRRA